MSALGYVASYAARESGRHVTITGGGFPVWVIALIVIAIMLLLAASFARPYGRYRSRRYVEVGPTGAIGGPAGRRTVIEEEDVA